MCFSPELSRVSARLAAMLDLGVSVTMSCCGFLYLLTTLLCKSRTGSSECARNGPPGLRQRVSDIPGGRRHRIAGGSPVVNRCHVCCGFLYTAHLALNSKSEIFIIFNSNFWHCVHVHVPCIERLSVKFLVKMVAAFFSFLFFFILTDYDQSIAARGLTNGWEGIVTSQWSSVLRFY